MKKRQLGMYIVLTVDVEQRVPMCFALTGENTKVMYGILGH